MKQQITSTIRSNGSVVKNQSFNLQSGFSLIEIMIAALVLSIGILGVAGLQIIGMKGTQQSHMKQQAVAVLHSLTERMHSNKPGVIARNYEADSDTFDCSNLPVCGTGVNCTPADIATVDLHNIFCGYKTGSAPNTSGVKFQAAGDVVSLSGGLVEIDCATDCSDGELQLKVEWQEQAFDQAEIDANGGNPPPKDEIILNTRIAL